MTSHVSRQPSSTSRIATAARGNTASPAANPSPARHIALPRSASKYRVMLVTAVWLMRPWPKSRSPKIAAPSASTACAPAIAKAAPASPTQTAAL